jgi:TolB-like protein/class 3 adenylate cyclase/tetratricopeptide (TPR) repeat protein
MAEERVQRRLAAILAADVVGYSRLMQADEAGTLAALKSRRKDIFQPLIAEHHGRIVKLMGDGALVEFGSAINAVTCAVMLQGKMEAANSDLPENRRIVLRIGVNLGDVIVEGSDLYGDGVNIAARLEALAEPGSVYVSHIVYSQVRGKLPYGFKDLGEQSLKNMAELVRVYRVGPGGEAVTTTRPGFVLPDKPSIAVLPFQNMSGDPEQEYFADGMVDDIITALSHMHWLFVIARNSSFTYKGRTVNVKQIGRELGVRYVLEGSVRKSGEKVRITGQLIDASTGGHLWAENFDGGLADIFDLQDQVTASVVGAIAPKLEAAEIERAKRKPIQNLDAYDYYLRGLAIVNQFTREANDESLRLFNKAIERDPDFVLPYARAAHCYLIRKANGWMIDPDKEIAIADRLARRAVEIGRDDAVALCYAGDVLAYVVGDLDDGNAFVERALTLNPNLAAAWGASGWMKICFGEPDTAINQVSTAMRLSPLDPRLFDWQTFTALAHFCAARYDDAAAWAQRALRDQPNYGFAMRVAAASYALAERLAQAQQVIARVREIDPQRRLSNLGDVMSPLRRAEDRAKWVEGLRVAGLPE